MSIIFSLCITINRTPFVAKDDRAVRMYRQVVRLIRDRVDDIPKDQGRTRTRADENP